MIKKEEIEYAPAKTAAAAPVAATPQMQMPISQPVIADPQMTAKQGVQADAAPQQAAPQQTAATTAPMQTPMATPVIEAPSQKKTYTTAPDAPVVAQPQQKVAEQVQPTVVQPNAPIPTAEQNAAQARRAMFGIEMPAETNIPKVNEKYWDKYGGYNWASNGGDFFQNAKEANVPLYKAMEYYDKWRRDNGEEPLDMMHQYAMYTKYDPFKSVKEQEEEEERLKRHQKWQKIGNVFNNLANLYGTMRGAPAAKYETDAELTERQQKQLDRVKALRQVAGRPYLEALEAKKAEDFKNRQLEIQAERNAIDRQKADLQAQLAHEKNAENAEKLKGMLAKLEAQANLIKAQEENTKARTAAIPEKMANEKKKTSIQQQRANNDTKRTRIKQNQYEDNKNVYTEVSKNAVGTNESRYVRKGADADKAAKEAAELKAAEEAAKKSGVNWDGMTTEEKQAWTKAHSAKPAKPAQPAKPAGKTNGGKLSNTKALFNKLKKK